MQHVPGTAVLLTRVRLINVRGFRDLDLKITAPEASTQPARPVTLIIGKNGTNKSTLLRAIALCLGDVTEASAMLSQPVGSIVALGVDTARITLEVVEVDGRTHELDREISFSGGKDVLGQGHQITIRPPSLSIFACGYGAGRSSVGTDAGRDYRVDDACASLFDYRRDLLHYELTLRRLQDFLGTDRYQRTLAGVKQVLDLGPEDQIELPRGGGVVITGPAFGKTGISLEGLADGYRLTFLWLLDLYGRAMGANQIEPDGKVRGIVLIDELDQHLHPSLQAAILPRLTQLLPATQFVATTHSPLLALGADPSELVVLRRRGSTIVVEQRVPDYRGYSAEDMLADDRLFDSPVYAPEMQKRLARYEELVAKGPSDRNRVENEELATLAKDIDAQPLPPAVDDKLREALDQIRAATPG